MMKHLGALNYSERMRAIGDRAKADFLETYVRLNAISLGLQEFYGISKDDLRHIDHERHIARTRIEGAVTWLRNASNLLGRARLDEQGCVVRVTLEATHEGASLLDELKTADGRTAKFSDNLITAGMKRVRLRGVSAAAEPLSGDSWIDIEVTSPQQKLSSIDLTLPEVNMRVGRVSSSSSLSIRDVAGGRPIVNRSPSGDWKVRAINDLGAERIARLHLDFHLSFC
jgi:hypothetical protein